MKVSECLPSVFKYRLQFGGNLSSNEAHRLMTDVPSLMSSRWSDYWAKHAERFASLENFRAACMCYVMATFPREDTELKWRAHEKKRECFQHWARRNSMPVSAHELKTSEGTTRAYFVRPPSTKAKVPTLFFMTGLEGSSEEVAFPICDYLNEGFGAVLFSVPGSFDYDRPMHLHSDILIRALISESLKEPWIDANSLGFVGFSLGAFWTLIIAKTDPRIRHSLVSGIPFLNTFDPLRGLGFNPWITHAMACAFRLKHPVQLALLLRRMMRRGKKLLNKSSGPILAINGPNDSLVNPKDTTLIGRAKGNRLLWIPGGEHCGIARYHRMIQAIFAWVNSQSRP